MADWDRRLAFYIAMSLLGVALFVVAALGEFVFRWWNELGLWLALGAVGLAVVFGLLAASKLQVRELGGEIRAVGTGVGRVEASTQRIEGTAHRIEASTERVEANTQRIEASTERIGGHTAEAVILLREIRDRLPLPGR